jgi:hypothetical protein
MHKNCVPTVREQAKKEPRKPAQKVDKAEASSSRGVKRGKSMVVVGGESDEAEAGPSRKRARVDKGKGKAKEAKAAGDSDGVSPLEDFLYGLARVAYDCAQKMTARRSQRQ